MLSSIKEKIKGWVAYVIIALIVVPFALFGVSEYFTGTSNVVVATIGSDDISKETFLSEFELQKRRLQQELGKSYTAEVNQAVKMQTINSMINRHLLEQLAEQLGYATTQHELQVFIQSNDVFKVDGKFSVDRYRQLLRLSGFSDVEYEALQTNELTQNQIKYNFLDSAFITPSALKRVQLLNDQKRQFSYILLSVKEHSKNVKVNSKSVKEFYESQKKAFFEPQKVKVDFVELSFKQVAKNIEVSEDELFNFYEDESVRFTTEEERKAQHILVESKILADSIVAEIKAGGDFTELAIKHSIDTGSKDNGGDLGFFGLGVMVPEFESKVFSMKVGEVSVPVKTDFGYHIIKLTEIKASAVKPFEEVRDELTKLYTERAAQKLVYKLTDNFSNLAYEASLEEVAAQMDLKLKTSVFFPQNSKNYDAKFIAAAYSDAVLNKGENSEPIELGKDKLVVLRINNKIAQRQKDFKEVKAEITQHLTGLLAKKFINDIANKIAIALDEGDTKAAEKLIEKYNLKWKKMGWVGRDVKKVKVNINIVNSVFTLPKPSASKSVTYAARSIAPQEVVVLKLSAVKAPDNPPNATLMNVLLSFEVDEVFRSILATLRKGTDIEIFANNL
ncbi:SurA N-terminal domain-containing protein [Candidatus Thiodubiliella endoseptemdiera]|uniref:Periplasmic chaperone PpiD n=1 Tax=Candidatus Thiodubiliella endoseptemdiera TaxID=2738886 RepID=A0A853F1Q4_9GAMM|nr:SurA N-terminal domain-containing protein [Candidatus Thiodubiliella endoseptemdiera]